MSYCLGIFCLVILEDKLFMGLYFSTPVTLWLGMFSPGWCSLGNKLEKILKTLTPSLHTTEWGSGAPGAGKDFFSSWQENIFVP